MALVYYAVPRTTVDIDIVVEMTEEDLPKFVKEFENDYYIPGKGIGEAVLRKRIFNVLNQEALLKIDCIIRKDDEFHLIRLGKKYKV